MSEETEKAFHRVLKRKQQAKVNGYRHFLFFSSNGYPIQEDNYKSMLRG